MQRVESGPSMTAMAADHRLSVSAFPPDIPSTSPATTPVLPVSVVSILSLSAIVLLSTLVLSSLVLTGPAAGSLVSGGAGLKPTNTR